MLPRSLAVLALLVLGPSLPAQGLAPTPGAENRGTCGPVLFSSQLGELIELTGTPDCTVDIYTNFGCSEDPGNFLGTFSLGSTGHVDIPVILTPECYRAFEQGSVTSPLGSVFAPANSVQCSAFSQARIGGSVNMFPTASGTAFHVTYNGTVYIDPVGSPTGWELPGIVGGATSVRTEAFGFDGLGQPLVDEVTCTLDFVSPMCSTFQDPDSTVTPVDYGTVIDLVMTSTGALTASIDGVPMTADVDPETNESVQWSASHVATADAVLTGTATNPDDEEISCTWAIDVNCVDPTIESVAPVGQRGIVIAGTPDCVHSVSITTAQGIATYDLTIGTDGFATLDVDIPPDALIEVGSDSFTTGPLIVVAVPTLNSIALVVLTLLLAGVAIRRLS